MPHERNTFSNQRPFGKNDYLAQHGQGRVNLLLALPLPIRKTRHDAAFDAGNLSRYSQFVPEQLFGEKPFDADSLKTLIGLQESQTLEFKGSLAVTTVKAKEEFAADVAAFANSSGGTIVFGIEENKGKAARVNAMLLESWDRTELQLRQILAANIEPPVPGLAFETVQTQPGEYVFALRIPRSWVRPHGVGIDVPRFFVRDGNRKRPLRVQELREAFGFSTSITERIKLFRTDRLGNLITGNGPATLAGTALIILHIMPVSAFDSPTRLNLRNIAQADQLLWPIAGSGVNVRVNFDGIFSYSPFRGPVESYVQVFHNGCVEAANASLLAFDPEQKLIPYEYEPRVEEGLRKYLNVLQANGIEPPVFVSLAFIGAKGYRFRTFGAFGEVAITRPIDQDVLVLPEVMVSSYAPNYFDILREPFDRVWQATGRLASPSYDENGKWIK